MIGRLGRRLIDATVLAFALYAFCFVPLGSRTGLGHAKAVFTTEAARRAGHDLVQAALRLHHAMLDALHAAMKSKRSAPRDAASR